jgi:hypothetical protein
MKRLLAVALYSLLLPTPAVLVVFALGLTTLVFVWTRLAKLFKVQLCRAERGG